MYLPEVFAVDDLPTLYAFIEQFNFAVLVTQLEGNLVASHIPFVLDRETGGDREISGDRETGGDPQSGARGRLRAHIAVQNPQRKHLEAGSSEALVIFQGPHGYISPNWYASPLNVPTWNYTAVHAYGRPRMLDRAGLVILLKDLVRQHERALPRPWDFDPQAGWIEKLLPHITGFEIPIERIEGKFKLNQNRVDADRARVVEMLSSSPDAEQRRMAELIQEARRPKRPTNSTSPSRKS